MQEVEYGTMEELLAAIDEADEVKVWVAITEDEGVYLPTTKTALREVLTRPGAYLAPDVQAKMTWDTLFIN